MWCVFGVVLPMCTMCVWVCTICVWVCMMCVWGVCDTYVDVHDLCVVAQMKGVKLT